MATPKNCDNCRMKKICILFKMAEAGVESFNGQQEVMKFPFAPKMLALTCPMFESEEDVVKILEKTDNADPIENPGEKPLVQ